MKRVVSSKESTNGVFWVIDDRDELLSYPFDASLSSSGIAKSCNTFNHKRLWNDLKPLGSNMPYNYYPRGRVDWDNQGRPTIYLNPNVGDDYISQIKLDFGIRPSDNCRIFYDFSDHYKCHLDEGWRPDK